MATTAPKKGSAKKVSSAKTGADAARLRIRVRAYEHKILDASVKQIIDTALRFEAQVIGPIPLPTKRTVFPVGTSPFTDKDAREHYEMLVHKRLIDILDPSDRTIDSLSNLDLPAGVSIEIKM